MQPTCPAMSLALALTSLTAVGASDIHSSIKTGELSAAERAIRTELVEAAGLPSAREQELRSLLSTIRSVSKQFNVSYQQMFSELKERIPDLSAQDITRWEKDDVLEHMLIDGEKRYFSEWQFDLFQLSEEARRRAGVPSEEAAGALSDSLMREVIAAAAGSPTPYVCPRPIQVSFSYFEDVSEVPDGEVLRGWLPVARRNQFQNGIEVVKSSVIRHWSL